MKIITLTLAVAKKKKKKREKAKCQAGGKYSANSGDYPVIGVAAPEGGPG